MRTVIGLMAMVLVAQGNLLGGGVKIKDIDIIVKKQPTGTSKFQVSKDANGRVRFNITEPGSYTLEATAPAGADPISIMLCGNFTRQGAGTGNPVSGKYVDGNTLFAAGPVRSDGRVFSVDLEVSAPAAFVGTLEAEGDISIMPGRHITIFGIAGGPVPPVQTVTITNGSGGTLGYTAALEFIGSRWSATLSKPSGSIPPGGRDSIDIRTQNPLPPAGQYDGFLRIKKHGPDGDSETAVAITLFVQTQATSKAVTLLDAPMQALFPLPSGGGYEPGIVRVTNNGSTPETYTTRPDAGLTGTPGQLTLAPGESGTITTQVDSLTTATGGWVKRCIVVVSSTGIFSIKCYWVYATASGGTASSAVCAPSSLQPVITGLSSQIARLGHPLDVTVQAYDNCGNPVQQFTGKMVVKNGAAEAHIAAVQSTNKAINKTGNSFDPIPGTRGVQRKAQADAAQELVLAGYTYPYFTNIAAEGLTLQVEVQADNPAGGPALTGVVEMLLPYDSDPNAPLVTQGAMVSNVTFEPVAMAPFEVFALFAVVPGLPADAAKALPFPTTLSGLRVLVDGNIEAPLIRVANGQIPGLVPKVPPGNHIVNLVYNNRMSGAIEFYAADTNPAGISTGTPNELHIYDPAGTLVTKTNPLRLGKVYTIYANGMGEMAGIDQVVGQAAPAVAMKAKSPLQLSIGENIAILDYAGRSPGQPTLDQVNFHLDQINAPGGKTGDVVQLSVAMTQGSGDTLSSGSTAGLVWSGWDPGIGAKVNYSFNTVPLNLTYQVNGLPHTGAYGPVAFGFFDTIKVGVSAPLQSGPPGTQYQFATWTAPLATTAAPQTFTPSDQPSVPTTVIAYFVAQHKLTIVGTATTQLLTNPSGIPPTTDGHYSVSLGGGAGTVQVTGSCPGGAQVTGLLVVSSAGSFVLPNPSIITMSQPTTVTVQCAQSGYPITLTSCNGVQVGPVSLLRADGTWPPGANLSLIGTPPAGGLVNVKITMGGVTKTYTSLPIQFTLTGPAAIVVECNNKSTACIAAPGGMVGWYSFDELAGPAYGDLTANPAALSGPATAGVLTNVAGTQFLNGVLQTSSSPAKYNFGAGDFSVDFWMHTVGPNSLFINKMTTTGNPQGWSLALRGGRLQMIIGDGTTAAGTTWLGTANNLHNRVPFTHITVTVSRTLGVTFYIDGQIDPFFSIAGTTVANSISNTEPLRMGSGTELYLDEVEIFNRVLTVTEAQQLYLAGTFGKCKPPTGNNSCYAFPGLSYPYGMVGWWGFDTAVASSITDLSGNSNVGSIIGTNGAVAKVGAAFGVNAASYMKVPHSSALNLGGGAFSIDMWVKVPAYTGSTNIELVNKWDGNTGYRFDLQIPPTGGTAGLTLLVNQPSGSLPGAQQWFTSDTATNQLTMTAIAADGNWHLVGATYDPAISNPTARVVLYVDGVPVHSSPETHAQNGGIPATVDNTADLYIGAYGPSPAVLKYSGEIDEVEIFKRALTPAEMLGIFSADVLGKCKIVYPIIVNTLPPAIGATVALAPGGSASPSYSTTAAAGNYVATAPAIVTSATTEYRLKTANTWSLNTVPQVWTGTSTPTYTVSAATTFTANYDTYYKVTLTDQGCSAAGIPGVGPGSGTGWLLAGSTLTASVGPITGYSVVNGTLNGVAVALVNGQFPISVSPVTGPVTIVVNCAPIAGVVITVKTAPSPLLAFSLVGNATIAGNYTGLTTYTATPGATGYSHSTTTPQTVGGGYYTFGNWTSSAGPTTANLTQSASPIPATPTTFTANFNLIGYVVTVVNNCNGNGSIGPASQQISSNPLIFAVNAPLTATVTPGSGLFFQNFQVTQSGGAPQSFTTNPANLGPLTGPITVTINCTGGLTHTVTTLPVPLKVTIDGGAQLTAPQTTPAWASGSPHTLGAPSPQLNAAGNTQYTLSGTTPWTASNGSITNAGAIASAPAVATTYTANFNVSGYLVTFVNQCGGNANFGPASQMVSNNPLIFAPNAAVTGTVSPNAGQTFQNFTVVMNGSTQIYTTNPASLGTLTGPMAVTINCTAGVTHTITTTPTGLSAQSDGGALTVAPFTVNWNPASAHQLTAPNSQILSGTLYGLNSTTPWTASSGSITNTGAVASAPSIATTYTALYTLRGYVVTTSLTGCSVTVSSAVGSLQTNPLVYPANATLQVAALSGTSGIQVNGAAAQALPATISVTGPITITPLCGSPQLLGSFVSRTLNGGLALVVLRVTNNGQAAANGVQVATSIVGAGSGTQIGSGAVVSLGNIAPGANATYTITVSGAPAGSFNASMVFGYSNAATGLSGSGSTLVTIP